MLLRRLQNTVYKNSLTHTSCCRVHLDSLSLRKLQRLEEDSSTIGAAAVNTVGPGGMCPVMELHSRARQVLVKCAPPLELLLCAGRGAGEMYF